MTSTETRGSWSDRLSPRNWSLAWKLVAVGLVPALLAIVLGVLRVADQANTASELGAANRLLTIRQQVADTAVALRVERDRATTFVAERRLGDRGPLQEAVRSTDDAVERLRAAVPTGSDLDPTTRNAVEQAQGGFALLPVLRTQVDGDQALLPTDALNNYSGVVARTDVLDRSLLRQVRIPDTAGLVDALTAVTAASEAVTLQHTVVGAALRVGTVSPADRAAIGTSDNAFLAAYTEYQVALPPSQTPVKFVTSRANAQRDADKATILSAPTPGPISVSVQQWDADSRAAVEPVDAAGASVTKALVDAGNSAEARSSNLAGLNSVLLMLGVLAAATIVVLMSRSLTRSLRILRTSALEIAGRRLPHAVDSIRSGGNPDITIEPVPLRSRDEIGEVARAFDEVHDQALRLAVDQAALQSSVSNMFVNLSRRSQGLVERQLQLIEQLESNEQDPDQLSNLFQLDHLATRMRRNSENLLVLAGTDFAKRNVAPVPLVDVLRAAVSEIEHYQRVVVQAPPQATIVGRSTSDVVHLLAELLDNATSFSPPESQVVISSHRTADGSILVEIADRGVGMPDQELADANRRLSSPATVDVSASRRMGLYVVGRLGVRHGITVHLGGASMGGPGGGLTASVTLPTHLVVGVVDGGGRPPRAASALTPAAPTSNGVPPQRAGQLNRPGSPPPLAAPAPGNGTPLARPGGANGLPTRTPGTSLRRDVKPLAAADPGTGEHRLPTREAAEKPSAGQPVSGQPVSAQPGSRDADGAERPARRPDGADKPDGADGADADSVPTGVVPAVTDDAGERAEERTADADRSSPDAERQRTGASALPRRTPRAKAGDTASPTAAEETPTDTSTGSPDGPSPAGRPAAVSADAAATDDDRAAVGSTAADGGAADDTGRTDAPPDDEAPDDHDAAPWRQPAPVSGPNGTHRDLPVPSTRYDAYGDGAGQNGSAGQFDNSQYDNGQHGPGQYDPGQYRPDRNGGVSPQTTPLPIASGHDVAGSQGFSAPAASGPDDAADALFSASVPAIAEPDGLPRSRRPLAETRHSVPAGPTEATPIFEEIASAWFAAQRPVPVDWELGRRPGTDAEPDGAEVAPSTTAARTAQDAPPAPGRSAAARSAPPAPSAAPAASAAAAPAAQAAPAAAVAADRSESPVEEWPEEASTPVSDGSSAPVPVPAPQAFATEADEGWRAASGAAAERPDELTSAGLPKRRPRARLVPGSAGSAVLAAPASPSRSAESVRGRLASYQQGVRQGRENRLRRDPGGTGPQPDTTGENAVVPTDDRGEETR